MNPTVLYEMVEYVPSSAQSACVTPRAASSSGHDPAERHRCHQEGAGRISHRSAPTPCRTRHAGDPVKRPRYVVGVALCQCCRLFIDSEIPTAPPSLASRISRIPSSTVDGWFDGARGHACLRSGAGPSSGSMRLSGALPVFQRERHCVDREIAPRKFRGDVMISERRDIPEALARLPRPVRKARGHNFDPWSR